MEKELSSVVLIASYVFGMLSMKYILNPRPIIRNVCNRFASNAQPPAAFSEEEISTYQNTLKLHQRKAKRLSVAEEARTLIEYSNGYGVLSTNSSSNDGFPYGSVVGFQIDKLGHPFFVFSKLSSHTKDVVKDGRVSLVVMSKDFKGASEGRVTLVGELEKVVEEDNVQALRDLYLKRHTDAFWIDFGDFSYFRMKSIVSIRYVGGFARAATIAATEYLQASPDSITATVSLGKLNQQYASNIPALVKKHIGVPCVSGEFVSADQFGVTISAMLPYSDPEIPESVRLPFAVAINDSAALDQLLESRW